MADVLEVLTQQGDAIVERAATALERSGLRHYAQAGPDAARDRLGQLYALVVESVSTRDLVAMINDSTRPRGGARVGRHVLGTGRAALACTYVSLATHQHVPSLDLSALFRGGV